MLQDVLLSAEERAIRNEIREFVPRVENCRGLVKSYTPRGSPSSLPFIPHTSVADPGPPEMVRLGPSF
jgi:hypothetical protein